MVRIVAIDYKFFSDYGLYKFENELIPNNESGSHRPYVIVVKLKYNGILYDFAIPFRSNIAGHRKSDEYFALPPRKETKAYNVHGLHFIKMFPVKKEYFVKYNYPMDNPQALITLNFIKKNIKRLVNEAQNYLIKFADGYRPEFCVNISDLCKILSECSINEQQR